MKSKLKIRNLNMSDNTINAIKKTLGFSIVNGRKLPRITQEELKIGSVTTTQEVDFDTEIMWKIQKLITTWARKYEYTAGVNTEIFTQVLDNYYVSSGNSNYDPSGLDKYYASLWKLKKDGSLIKLLLIGIPDNEVTFRGVHNTNSNILVYGHMFNYDTYEGYIILNRFDYNLNLQQSLKIGSPDNMITGLAVIQEASPNIILFVDDFEHYNLSMVTINPTTYELLSAYGYSYDIPGYAVGVLRTTSAIKTTDDNYLILSYDYLSEVAEGYQYMYITKITSDGNILWCKGYTNTSHAYSDYVRIYTSNIVEGSDGYYIIADTDLFSPTWNTILMKVDFNGNLLWAKLYQYDSYRLSSQYDSLEPVGTKRLAILSDGLLFSAVVKISDVYYLVLIKTDFNGNVVWAKKYYTTPGYYNTLNKIGDYVLVSNNTGLRASTSYQLIARIDMQGGVRASTFQAEDVTSEISVTDITSQIAVDDVTTTMDDISSQLTITDITGDLQLVDVTDQVQVTEL